MRLSTPSDIKANFKLHKHIHMLNRMNGPLDCMNMFLNNWPVVWQGIVSGKVKIQPMCWKLLVIITYGFGICHLIY